MSDVSEYEEVVEYVTESETDDDVAKDKQKEQAAVAKDAKEVAKEGMEEEGSDSDVQCIEVKEEVDAVEISDSEEDESAGALQARDELHVPVKEGQNEGTVNRNNNSNILLFNASIILRHRFFHKYVFRYSSRKCQRNGEHIERERKRRHAQSCDSSEC